MLLSNKYHRELSLIISKIARLYGTPFYFYDERMIVYQCAQALHMLSNKDDLTVRYAMKANSNSEILRIINGQGLFIDASSFEEAQRAILAGINPNKIMLTSQLTPTNPKEKALLKKCILAGMKYNVCSPQQYQLIKEFIQAHKGRVTLAMRVHPGEGGSGESSTRDTANKYSCFGVQLFQIPAIMEDAKKRGIVFDTVHVHIGSGGDPEKWRENIDRELKIVAQFFPDAKIVSFGGGLKVDRMDNSNSANILELGQYAEKQLAIFRTHTGRKLHMEVEPGTFIMAMAGRIATTICDIKTTGSNGYDFLVLNGGMEMNARPVMYEAIHPSYIVTPGGLIVSGPDKIYIGEEKAFIPVGRCCESGDTQSLQRKIITPPIDEKFFELVKKAGSPEALQKILNQYWQSASIQEEITPRKMGDPGIGYLYIIGGAGAYCASMCFRNYNSYREAPEYLLRPNGQVVMIRRLQTIQQITENECCEPIQLAA